MVAVLNKRRQIPKVGLFMFVWIISLEDKITYQIISYELDSYEAKLPGAKTIPYILPGNFTLQ
jgi:hypothetical protein